MMDKSRLIVKYAKKFAAEPKDGRPLLEGIHYAPDGTTFVTNGKYALRLKNAHHFSQPLTLHAKTGTPLDGEYPDINKIFDSCSFSSKDMQININQTALGNVIKRARCAADVASRLDKQDPVVSIVASNGAAFLQIRDDDQQVELKAFFGNANVLDCSKVSLNAEYLYTALTVLNDTWARQVTVKIKGPLNPIGLTDEQDVDVLILPFRVAN